MSVAQSLRTHGAVMRGLVAEDGGVGQFPARERTLKNVIQGREIDEEVSGADSARGWTWRRRRPCAKGGGPGHGGDGPGLRQSAQAGRYLLPWLHPARRRDEIARRYAGQTPP